MYLICMYINSLINLPKIIDNKLDSHLCQAGCPRKNAPLFWRAIAPINFELGIKGVFWNPQVLSFKMHI